MRTRRGSRRPPGKRKAILIAVALLATVAIVAVAVYGNDQNVRSRVDEFIGRPGPSAATATETPLDIEVRVQAAVATARTAPSPAPDVRATTEAAIAATVDALRPTSTTEAVPLALAATPTRTPTGVPETRPTIPTPTPTKTPATIPSPAPTATSFPTPTPSVSLREFTNGPWLEQEDPRLASSIKELGWVRDGIDGTESEAIQDLLYIAVTSRSVVSSLVSLSWVRDGISADEAEAIDWINNMTGAEVMSAVVALGWVRDGINDLEVKTIEELSYIAYENTELGLDVVALGWVQDGIEDIEARAIDWINNIEGAEVMSAVVALGWVRDGINDLEVKTIEELSYIAYENTELGLDVVALGWVQDGIEDIEARAIDWINNIAGAEVMSAVVALGWVRDGIDDLEVKTIEELSYIAYENTELGLDVVALGWVQDGIEDIEARAIDWINNIAGAEVMSAVVTLGWVQDGINDLEVKTIEELSYIAYENTELGLDVVALGWVQDGIEDIEARAIDWISNIEGAEVMSAVVALGWVRDGINDLEVKTIEELSYIAYENTELGLDVVALGWVQDGIEDIEARAIDWINNIAGAEVMSAVVALGWVRDGINDLEVKTIEELSYIAYENTELGLDVVALGWVQDGIEDIEARAIDWISNIEGAEVMSAVVALGWVRDGIDDLEVQAFERLSYISLRDAAAALRIVGMPFIETIEPPDISAMASLSRLAASERNIFDRVMSHAALRDGISDDLAPIVATLRGVARTNVGLIDILLDPNRVSLERRTVTLPLAGDVVLAIIRTAAGAARSMDLLEHSVRAAERFMGASLPTNYVALLYEDAVHGSFAGTNFGTHIAILPKYDIDDGSHEAASADSTIAHEVAHYYWSGNADWVDEGAADLMASIVDGARTGSPVGATNLPCAYATTIADLESLGISLDDVEFGCNYSLGERLFVNLYRTLGHESFRQGFRALYLASEMNDDDPGASVGIEHVRQAFRADDGAERAVIARWYDGTEAYDLSQLDDSPVDPSLPSINGRIDEAYIVTETDGPAVSTFSARDVSDSVYLTLTHSYSVSGGPREVRLEVVEYFEDGFEFGRHTGKLTAEPGYIGGTHWFSVGPSPSRKWAPGRYVVYVYEGQRKVAEVAYEVLP